MNPTKSYCIVGISEASKKIEPLVATLKPRFKTGERLSFKADCLKSLKVTLGGANINIYVTLCNIMYVTLCM